MVAQVLGQAAFRMLAGAGVRSALRTARSGRDQIRESIEGTDIRLSVVSNIREVEKYLNDVQLRQMPYATANALNSTAFQTQRVLKFMMKKKLDRPMPFSVKGILVDKADKRQGSLIKSSVFIGGSEGSRFGEDRVKYLGWQVEGGVRMAGGAGTGVPTRNAELNKYGNIKGRRSGLVKKKNQFIGTIRGITGVWERGHRSKRGDWSEAKKSRASNVRLLIAFERQVNYKPKFPFYKIATRVIRNNFHKHMESSLRQALASAR